ncbi:MAG: sodium:solute symporter, partial [Clostridia bacterium]|nr:sodium:solute symporter [Clostridia bacterium]
MFLKILMIALFFVITVAVGLFYRKSAQSSSDFMLGGRNVGPWLSAFAYGTTYFSATVFVGYAGQFGWGFGTSAFWAGLGNAFIGSLLAWVLLGRRTRTMTKWLNSSTMPNYFEKRYDSKALKIAAAIIIVIFLVPYSASVYKGLSGLFAQCFDISFNWCIVGMAVLTAAFVIAGGYMGTAVNTFIQGLIMLVGMVLVIHGVLSANGGLMGSLTELSKYSAESAPGFNGVYTSMFGPDPISLLAVVILTSVGPLGLPQMVNKFYAIKNEKAIKLGTVISTAFAVIIAGGSYFIGAFGRLFWEDEKP